MITNKSNERFHIAPAPGVHATYCGAERTGRPIAIALKPEHVPPDRRTCAECNDAYAMATAPQRYGRRTS